MEQVRRADRTALAIAVLLLVAAATIAYDASTLAIAPTYGLGPKMMAYAVAGGLAALAIANFVLALRNDFPPRESFDAKAVILILGGFAVFIAIVAFGGGFIPATAVLFAATAAAFGRKALLADLGIGAVLALAAYLLFSKLLTLSLPQGPLERLL